MMRATFNAVECLIRDRRTVRGWKRVLIFAAGATLAWSSFSAALRMTLRPETIDVRGSSGAPAAATQALMVD